MEAVTLNGPPRPVMVQPVQKSLSLPSYARASGEGIDHMLIFAALEQREKVRRKSKIFKEKENTGKTRQNYFCLPLPSSKKCKETSLSSDTSCSSLEFQKPISPTKTTETIQIVDQNCISHLNKIDMNNNSDEGTCAPSKTTIVNKNYSECIQRTVWTPRSTIGSSDSMERAERSSKSSTDSLSRKERLVAIKARVEAERERQLCKSSSDEEEETSLRITRHNSDGIIHRTVREIKTKSSRGEKRVKRRNPEDSNNRRVARRQHKSLYIPSTVDLDTWKPPIMRSGSSFSLQKDVDDISKDFIDIENKQKYMIRQSASGNSYFSDICSGDYRSQFVRPMVSKIEALEQRSLNKDLVHQNRAFGNFENWRQSNYFSNERKLTNSPINNSQFFDNSKHPIARSWSPLELSSMKAPAPPPRSPKSTEIVNRAFIHHQNSTTISNTYDESCSLERKRSPFQHKPSSLSTTTTNSVDDLKKDIRNARRKTCSNFSQIELEMASARNETPISNHSDKMSHFPPRSPDLSQKAPNIFRKSKLTDLTNTKLIPSPELQVKRPSPELQVKRWEQIELDSEKKFNSLENRTSPYSESEWCKWKVPRKKHSLSCICPRNKQQQCNCFNTEQGFTNLLAEDNSLNNFSTRLAGKTNKFDGNLLDKVDRMLSSPGHGKFSNHNENNFHFETVSREYANENLDTAMEELESVYRSLRISCEDLTAKNNSDYQSDIYFDPKQNLKSEFPKNRTTSLTNNNTTNSLKTERSYSESDKVHYTLSPTPDAEKITSINDALCIEELFGDLTQQLDMEQKLLQETKKKQSSQSHNSIPKQKTESSQSYLLQMDTNINHITPNTTHVPEMASEEVTAISQRVFSKKKLKAVRSLSENIASLMSNDKARNPAPFKTMNSKDQTIDDNSKGCHEVTSSKNGNVTKRDEIWQIRVSMDSGKTPTEPPLATKATSSQMRLQSALHSSRDNVIQKNPVSSPRDRTTSRLSEGELEKLLSSLLIDVPNDIPLPPPASKDDDFPQSVTSKGVSGNVNKRYRIQTMEPSITSQTNNEKPPMKLLSGAGNISESSNLDNNRNRNNNDQGLSFQVGANATANTYCNADDNSQISPVHRNSSYLENVPNPRSAYLTRQGNVRRHSVGVEDFSDFPIYGGKTNSNEATRLPPFNPSSAQFNQYCSSDATSNLSSIVNPAEIQCRCEYVCTENQNVELDMRGSSNQSEGAVDPVNFNTAQSFEKLKDKSFVRKSSLNRLDFVEQVSHATGRTSHQHQSNNMCKQQPLSSSEACSDKDKSPMGLPIGPNPKRKNCIELPGIPCRQNCHESVDDCAKKIGNWPQTFKHRDGSLKIKGHRNPKMLFRKKAYSAGEQDSFSDQEESSKKGKICFSAQEICTTHQTESKSTVVAGNPCISSHQETESIANDACIDSNCDNSSQDSESKCQAGNGEDSPRLEDKELPSINHLQIDQDLFTSQSFVKVSPLRPFPVDNSSATVPSSHENNEVNVPSHHHHEQHNTASTEYVEEEDPSSSIVINSTSSESDKDISRQPGSILRRKSQDDRKERHGILKNAEDKLTSKQFPSILKHRESSEEKDVWLQSDLHSILKKSTSEDDSSSNNSPDIRPILKNTSTDDESSSLSSKPKPILKKRTSFSEECSYACFRSSELKPILKKKSIMEIPEDQPKPILKTRRKSEEAAATTSEFPIGTRPRAYSADRGVRKAEKMKTDDDDLMK